MFCKKESMEKCDSDHSFDTSILVEIRTKNINRLIKGNLNINSLSSKFDHLKVFIQGKIVILVFTHSVNSPFLLGD